MSAKRERIIPESPLNENNKVQLPSATTAPVEAPKTFSYRLPPRLGLKFKMWCQMEGTTAEKKLSEILSEFLSDKEVRF